MLAGFIQVRNVFAVHNICLWYLHNCRCFACFVWFWCLRSHQQHGSYGDSPEENPVCNCWLKICLGDKENVRKVLYWRIIEWYSWLSRETTHFFVSFTLALCVILKPYASYVIAWLGFMYMQCTSEYKTKGSGYKLKKHMLRPRSNKLYPYWSYYMRWLQGHGVLDKTIRVVPILGYKNKKVLEHDI